MFKPLNVLNTFKGEWRKKTPKQKWLFIYNIAAKSSEAIGIRVYTDLKITWFSYFGAAMGLVHFPCVFHTLWISYKKGELLKGMQCTCTCAIMISVRYNSVTLQNRFEKFLKNILRIFILQTLTVYVEVIGRNRFKVNNVINFGGNYIYKDDKEPTKYNALCERMIKALIRSVVITMAAIAVSYSTFGASSLYFIIFEGARVTFLGTELPFFDINSDFGYMMNMFEQSVLTFGAIMSNTTIEIGACITNNAVEAVPEIIHLESEELTDDLMSNGMTSSATLRVRNMLVIVQDFNRQVHFHLYSEALIN